MNVSKACALIALSLHWRSVQSFTSLGKKSILLSVPSSSLRLSSSLTKDSFDAIDDPVELMGRERLQQYFNFEVDSCKYSLSGHTHIHTCVEFDYTIDFLSAQILYRPTNFPSAIR